MTSDLAFFEAAPVQYVDLGTPVAYRAFGNGPAILFVHGWPLRGATYRSLVRRLSHNFTCYVPDLPGAGDSPWDARTRDLFVDYAALLVRFVDALALRRFAIVAHDSGGGIARFAAAQLGDRVALLALSDTEVPDHTPWLVAMYVLMARVPGLSPVMRMLVEQRWFRKSALGFGDCFTNRDHLDGEFHGACVAPFLANFTGAQQVLRHVSPKTLAQLPSIHRQISAPVLLTWGERDTFFPVERARAMSAQFPNLVGFHVLPGQGLFVHDEAPELIARHLEPALHALLPDVSSKIAATA